MSTLPVRPYESSGVELYNDILLYGYMIIVYKPCSRNDGCYVPSFTDVLNVLDDIFIKINFDKEQFRKVYHSQ